MEEGGMEEGGMEEKTMEAAWTRRQRRRETKNPRMNPRG